MLRDKRQLLSALLVSATLLFIGADAPTGNYTETIPKTTITFDMVKLPDGKIELAGKEFEIKNLWIGKHEVTWDEYDLWAFKTDLTDEQKVKGVDAESRPSNPYAAPDRGFGHHLYPALGIPDHAARMYAKWLSAKTGKKYRLPTEAEWEYACRAGKTGDEKMKEDELNEVAWWGDNADDKAHEVGKKDANAWGIHDMLGNISEWCQTADGKWLVRGGSYNDDKEDVTCTSTQVWKESWQAADPQIPKSKWWLSDGPFVGFRLVREE